MYKLTAAVAWSSSDDNAICYVLPVFVHDAMFAYMHCESKKGATLTMAITLSILDYLRNSFTAAKSSKFRTKPI